MFGGARVLAACMCALWTAALGAAVELGCAEERRIDLKGAQGLEIAVRSLPPGARLRVEEVGADLSVEHPPGSTPLQLTYPMTRYGWRDFVVDDSGANAVRIQLSRATHGSARVQLLCEPVDATRAEWLARALVLADSIDRSVQSRPEIAEFEALLESAPDAHARASARHMYAGALFLVDRYADSAAAFGEAHRAWAALGERSRAGAALLGMADLELRLERHAQAGETASRVLEWLDSKGDAYLKVRARQVHCLQLDKQGESARAADCNEALIPAYRAAGDSEDALRTAVTMLNSLRNTPDRKRLERLVKLVESDPALGTAPAMLRGAFFFLRAYLHRDHGDLPEALADFERAMDSFEAGTEERVRWQANVLVQVARIYGQFGMSDQAYRLLERALLLYQPASSPGRIASALMALASIERSNARAAPAALWFERAHDIYRLLAMPTERAEAELGMLELRTPATPAAARAELDRQRDWSALSAANRGRLELLTVRWLVVAERLPEAQRRLAALKPESLDLPQWLLATRLRAQLMLAQGKSEEALVVLAEGLARLAGIARQTGNGGLGYLVMRFGRELREDWVRIALARSTRPPGTQWWLTLGGSSPLQAVTPAGSDDAAADFSAAVSRELLGDNRNTGASERALLSALAGRQANARPHALLPTLAAVQAELEERWLLIVVPAEPSSAALWLSKEHASVVELPGRAQLRESIQALLLALNTPTASVAGIDRAALTLSGQMLQGAPLASAPPRLLVLSDDLIGTIPLGLLRWPGNQAPLIETTTLSWVTRFESSPVRIQAPATRLHAVIAPGNATTARVGLARLRYAEREADLIAGADPEHELIRHTGAGASRDALVAALKDPAAWVHLAAHGFARPQMLGYAGTWLASPADPGRSEFLSWLDVANTALAAPLAVLNACQLAAGPSVTSQSSLSFAVAVSAAGIDHVVAAFWPISDSASALWIPAFYAAMHGHDAPHSAAALRTAQLALKASRAYRHPYYWASLAHFQRLQVAR